MSKQEQVEGSRTQSRPVGWLSSQYIVVILFAFLTAGIMASGVWYFTLLKSNTHQEAALALAAIADLKTQQIQDWRAARLREAGLMMADPQTAKRVRQFIAGPRTTEETQALQTWFRAIQAANSYKSLSLFDQNGEVFLSVGQSGDRLGEQAVAEAPQVLQTGQILLTDLHRSPDQPYIHMDLIVPVPAEKRGNSSPGAILIRVDPNPVLYPLILSWPTPSPSGEALLVRREGYRVLFLNELRHQKNTALELSFPLNTLNLPAALTANGAQGANTGMDYRGVAVLAAYRPIPDSPWGLVAKVDLAEVDSPLRKVAGSLAVVVSLFLLVAGLAGTNLRRRREIEGKAERQALVQHFDYLVKYATDMVFLADANGRVVEVNESALSGYGYTREEMLQLTLADMRAPQAHEDPGAILHRIGAAGEGGARYETLHLRKDGTVFPVELSARLIEVEGVRYYQSIGRDITERKLAEEKLSTSEIRYRRLFEAARDGILILDAENGMVVDVNPYLVELLGYSREEFFGKKVWELGFFKDIAANEDNFAELRQKDYIHYENLPLETSGGRSIEVEFFSHVYLVNQQRVVQCNIRDITSRRRAEAQLVLYREHLEELVAERTKALEESNRELEAFSYSVSHDLRAPVRAMDGFAKILEEDYAARLDAEGRRVLSVIRVNSGRMGHLIDDLLRLSRIGRKEIERATVDMNALARSAMNDLSPSNPVGVEVAWGDLPPAEGDTSLLKQVWLNYLSNALKFSRKASPPRIEVGGAAGENEITYWVRDNGVGYDARYEGKLFGVFQRLHGQEEFEGTGVGLAIVQRVVQRHGGRAWGEGQVGRGATFWFSLPLERA